MALKCFFLAIVAAGVSSAAVIVKNTHRYGTCHQLEIPITASVDSAIYNYTHAVDDTTTASWAIDVDTWSSASGAETIIKNTTTSGTYNIHAQLCFPNQSPGSVLQIATHGGFYDSRYWDSKLKPEQYSYVEAALKAGYSILTYDRLGTGQSDHPDGHTVVQAPLELEILRQLTTMARNGSVPIGKDYEAPQKMVHVGHSFGSFMTSAFISTYPDLTDGAIITGYILGKYFGAIGYTSWNLVYAATAGYDRTSGYAVPQKSGIQNVFFGGDPTTAFTSEALDYGDAIKQPIPQGELASAHQLVGVPGPGMKGPIHYMLPENDFFICAGDCKNTYSLNDLRKVYPNAAAIEVDIQPNTGHALPLHNNATAGFQASFDFLERHGLGTAAEITT